jgi:hypothetical protein
VALEIEHKTWRRTAYSGSSDGCERACCITGKERHFVGRECETGGAQNIDAAENIGGTGEITRA